MQACVQVGAEKGCFDSVHHFPILDFNKHDLIYTGVHPFNYVLVHKRASFISFPSSPLSLHLLPLSMPWF